MKQIFSYKSFKTLALLHFSILSINSFAQTTYLYEDFSSNLVPPQAWSLEAFSNEQYNPWAIDNFDVLSDAGGVIPEARFLYFLPATGTSRLISPVIDLSGVSQASLTFRNSFVLDSFGSTIGIAIRSGSGSWNVVWQETPSASFAPRIENINLNLSGPSDFQFCFFVSANQTKVGIWFLDEIHLSSPLNLDAHLSSLNVPDYIATNADFPIKGTVTNNGLTAINSFKLNYSLGGGNIQTEQFSGLNIELANAYEFTLSNSVQIASAGASGLKIWLTDINGANDQNLSNDSLSQTVWAIATPPSRMVLTEATTGTWCGYCVRNSCFMNYMDSMYPDTWIGVAVHNRDAMTCGPYDLAMRNIIPNFNGGYPSVTTDRTEGSSIPEGIEAEYLRRITEVSPASIQIHNYEWDPLNREMSFDLQAEFFSGINKPLRFGAIITEDSVTGYSQSNNYSGGSTPMCGLEDLPNLIPASQMRFDHVARTILDSPYGTGGSIPSNPQTGDLVSYRYVVPIASQWNPERLKVIGFIVEPETGKIINATDVISAPTGVSAAADKYEFALFPNPVKSILQINTQGNQVGESFRIYDRNGRCVASGFLEEHLSSISLASLPNGVYMFRAGLFMKKSFVLIKD